MTPCRAYADLVSEEPRDAAERMAEMMAWHGMARYADPEVLAAYARAPESRSDDARRDGNQPARLRA